MTASRIRGPAGPTGATGATGPPGPGTVVAGVHRTYLVMGAAASGYSTPDGATLDVTGTIDLRAYVQPTAWTASADQALISKWNTTGNNRSYVLSINHTTGTLQFSYSADGIAVKTIASSVTIPSVGVPLTIPVWLRAVANPNVAGLASVTFYYGWDNATWTQIGAVATNATPGPWFSSSAVVYIGRQVNTATTFTGRFYQAQIWNVGSATQVAGFDARLIGAPPATYTDTPGLVWTPEASATLADDYINDQDFIDASLRVTRLAGSSIGKVLGAGSSGPVWSASRDLDARISPYNAVVNGTTDDGAAINAALVAAATAKVGLLLPAIAGTTIPIENLTLCPIRGVTHRVCGFKALASFSSSQLVRNWTTADWSGGETDHRVAPANPVLSATHTLNHYPVVENIDLDPGANTDLALLSWVAPQETGWINHVTMHGGSATEASKGTWGLDLQAGSVAGSGLNGCRVGQLTLYQYGWDRQISIDGQAGGGGDIHLQEVIQSPGKSYDASVWVRNCGGIAFGRLCLNSPADSGSHAQIYLVNVFGDFVVDKLYVQASATPSARPLILTADTTGGSTSVGSRRSAPVIREANFFPTGGGPYYPNGFITDMYNTVPYDSGTIGSDTVNLFTQMSYDGYEIKATNTDGTRVRHNYKAVT